MHEKPDFEALFNETEQMIYNLGLRLFRNREDDALDFAQDVYLQAYRKLDSFKGKAKASTWLYSLALNLGLNKIKKDKRIKIISGDDTVFENLAAPENEQPDETVLNLINKNNLACEIENALEMLPEHYRLPLILFFFESLSYNEISKRLGIPQGTLKSNVYRAKLQLRNYLKQEHIND